MLRANNNIHCHTFRLANVRIVLLVLGATTVVRSPAVVVPRCVPVPLLLPRVYHPGVPGTPRAHGALRGGIALIPIRCVCVSIRGFDVPCGVKCPIGTGSSGSLGASAPPS